VTLRVTGTLSLRGTTALSLAAESSAALRSTTLPLTLRVTHRAMTATTLPLTTTRPIAIEAAAAWLADCEVRRFSLWYLSFRTRQGRANQWPVHRPFVLAAGLGGLIDINGGIGFSVDRWR